MIGSKDAKMNDYLEWIMTAFSRVPTILLRKAYGPDGDGITIVAPTFEQWLKQNKDWLPDEEDAQKIYQDRVPKYPHWECVFLPNRRMDKDWINNYSEEIGELGFTVYHTKELGLYLGLNTGGYSFFYAHWLPLFYLRCQEGSR